MGKKTVITFLVALSFLLSLWLPCQAEATAPDVYSMQSGNPKISVSPKSVNCGSVKAGDLSACKAVTVKNTGTGQLVINPVTITGVNASEFAQTNDCANIVPGGFCTVNIWFSPQIPFGKKSAVLNIVSNDPKKPNLAVKLSGKAPPPVISVSPKSVNCGSVQVGSTSAKAVTIKNTGTSDLVISSITLTGTNAGEFDRTHDCSSLAKGAQCNISVTFTPASAGKKSAVLNIVSNDPKKPNVTVKLSGKGLAIGGGGGRAKATVNTWTAEKAIGMAILGQRIGEFGQGLDVFDEVDEAQKAEERVVLNVTDEILTFAKRYIFSPHGLMRSAGSESGKESCYDGGSMSYTLKWDGPSDAEECDEVSNAKLTVKFNNCRMDDVLMNGSLYMGLAGNLCAPSAMTIKFTNFSLIAPYEDLSFHASQLELAFTELVWWYETIKHLKMVLNGDMNANYKGYPYSVAYNNFYMFIDSRNNNYFETRVGGSLRGGCLDGWVSLETLEPVLIYRNLDCPRGGKLKISGNGELIVEFYSNGSLNIGGQHYNSCNELDTACSR